MAVVFANGSLRSRPPTRQPSADASHNCSEICPARPARAGSGTKRPLTYSGGGVQSQPAGQTSNGHASRSSRETARASGPKQQRGGEQCAPGARTIKRLRRATARAERRGRGAPQTLKWQSVSTASAASYRKHAKEFTEWARSQRLVTSTAAGLDVALERYLEVLFGQGLNPHKARMAIWGFSFAHDRPVDKSVLPRTHRALQGFLRAAPPAERDPMPWEACVLLCADLLDQGTSNDSQAAVVLILCFDGYFRPSECLRLTQNDLHVPTARRNLVAVTVRQAPLDAEGSPADLERARKGLPRALPAKNGHFDGTVLFGEEASVKADRGFIVDLVRALKRSDQAEGLFSLSLAQLETCIRSSATRLRLQRLRLTPHTARHGGPSEDFARTARAIPDIQNRGRWEHPKSVARYKKPGKLARQISLLPDAAAASFMAARKALPGRLLRALRR